MFDRGCQKIMEKFRMKWHPKESWYEYPSTFSVAAWEGLSLQNKRMHTLSDCQGCLRAHAMLQAKFPGTKHIPPPLTLLMSTPSTSQALLPTDHATDKPEITRKALSSINNASMQALGMPFSVQYCQEEKLMAKTTAEKKKVQRSVMQVCKQPPGWGTFPHIGRGKCGKLRGMWRGPGSKHFKPFVF